MHGTPHLRRPDIDNMLKTTLDGLVDSGLLTDDSIVASLFAKKRWCREGEAAATYIPIEYENPEGRRPPSGHSLEPSGTTAQLTSGDHVAVYAKGRTQAIIYFFVPCPKAETVATHDITYCSHG